MGGQINVTGAAGAAHIRWNFYVECPSALFFCNSAEKFKKGSEAVSQGQLGVVYQEMFPFWEKIPDMEKDYICQNSSVFHFPKGKNIHDGSECSGVILVRSGCLRLYMMSDEGKDITLYRLYSGDMCMLSASCVLDAITLDRKSVV